MPQKSLPPRKILLSNLAHLGDVVIATAALPVLRAAFPEVKIGFIVGSWAQDVLADHPLVDHIYLVDHWRHNRRKIPLWKKMYSYFTTALHTWKKIRKERYDVSINLYSCVGNATALYWLARIPLRIGYDRESAAFFLTHALHWEDRKQHVCYYYRDLLKVLAIQEEHLSQLQPCLADPQESGALRAKIPDLFWEKGWAVFQMGTGDVAKLWEETKWRELTHRFIQEGHLIIFTGKGDEENARIIRVIEDSPCTLNLCNLLSWKELVQLASHTKLLVSVDTAIGHVAAVFHVPTITLFCAMNEPNQWRPLNPRGTFLVQPISVDSVFLESFNQGFYATLTNDNQT